MSNSVDNLWVAGDKLVVKLWLILLVLIKLSI